MAKRTTCTEGRKVVSLQREEVFLKERCKTFVLVKPGADPQIYILLEDYTCGESHASHIK